MISQSEITKNTLHLSLIYAHITYQISYLLPEKPLKLIKNEYFMNAAPLRRGHAADTRGANELERTALLFVVDTYLLTHSAMCDGANVERRIFGTNYRD